MLFFPIFKSVHILVTCTSKETNLETIAGQNEEMNTLTALFLCIISSYKDNSATLKNCLYASPSAAADELSAI